MPMLNAETSTLLVIDFQSRLMPAIDEGALAVANAARLIAGADMLGVPALYTEQNPKGLGPTVAELCRPDMNVIAKTTFDSCRAGGFVEGLPARGALVVAGCEAHVCVLQTVLGLIARGRDVFVVRDAVGSRRAESKETAIARMARAGAEIVTTEMVLFEWLVDAKHPRFKEVSALVK